MDREFLDLYNRELEFINDHAAEFAREYPGIAERLGGLTQESQDPLIAGLLEGAAFLAARVQLKLKHEFAEFTNNYLDQILPNYLAPIPSALLAKIKPPYPDPALRDGVSVARDELMDAVFTERERRIACRYQLRSAVTLWPFDVIDAQYLPSGGSLTALGAAIDRETRAGLRITLTHRSELDIEDEPTEGEALRSPEHWFAGCRTRELPIHLLGNESDAVAIYEQLFAQLRNVFVRFEDQHGDPVVIELGRCIEPIGFSDDELLIPRDHRVFRGFHYLQEYFLFARKYLGFKIIGLRRVMRRLEAKTVDFLFAFSSSNPRLIPAVGAANFCLYATPAINLFHKTMDRISVSPNQHDYHVVPDRSKPMDFEPHRITEVYAHFQGSSEKVRVRPLYSAPSDPGEAGEAVYYYTIRRLPRRRTAMERQFGTTSNYLGTEIFLSISEPPGSSADAVISQLSVRGICSNRHLTEQLPVGEGGVDFRLLENAELEVFCVAGPTPPRPPVVAYTANTSEREHTGTVVWRLVNLLSLNQLGLVDGAAGRDGRAVRELLSLFIDPTDAAIERRIRGIKSVTARPIVRRMRHNGGVGVARGLEVTLTLEEKAFEGSGAFLLGAILSRFFAEYVSINHFTQTVLRTVERGEIHRWAPVPGERMTL